MIHIKEFIFMLLRLSPFFHLRFKFSIRNLQCFRFIFYQDWKIPVCIRCSLFLYLSPVLSLTRPIHLSINIEWFENDKTFLHTHERLFAPETSTQSSQLIFMEMMKILLVGENRKIIQINDGENWQFSFVHDENKLRIASPSSSSSPYTWFCIQIAIFISKSLKCNETISCRLDWNLIWIFNFASGESE